MKCELIAGMILNQFQGRDKISFKELSETFLNYDRCILLDALNVLFDEEMLYLTGCKVVRTIHFIKDNIVRPGPHNPRYKDVLQTHDLLTQQTIDGEYYYA